MISEYEAIGFVLACYVIAGSVCITVFLALLAYAIGDIFESIGGRK